MDIGGPVPPVLPSVSAAVPDYFQLLIENSHDIIYRLDPEGRFVFISPSWTSLLGHSASDALGRSAQEYMHPEDYARCEACLERMVQTGEHQSSFEYRIRHADGSWRWHNSNVIAVLGRDGQVLEFQGSASDITRHKKTEAALAEALKRQELLLEVIPIPVFYKDSEGKYTGCNSAFTSFVDRNREEILGRTAEDLWPERLASIYANKDRQLMEYPQTVQVYEAGVRHHDGTVHDVIFQKVVLADAEKGVQGLIGVFFDLSERKRHEEALRESESNFRTFFNAVEDLNIVSMLDGEIVYTNPALSRALGYTAEELVGMHILDLHFPAHRKEAGTILQEMFRGERDYCQLPLQSKQGSIVPVETRVWYGKWSGTDCLFGVCKDLSKEQEALQKFTRLFHANPALMAVSELEERRFVDVNEAFLAALGYERSEVIGRTSRDLGLNLDEELHAQLREDLQLNGHVRNREMKVRAKDGSVLEGLFSGEVIESQGKLFFLTVMIDQTEVKRAAEERKQMDARLTQVQKAESLGILAGGIAHHFNNLAMAILGHAELAEFDLPDHASHRKHLEAIRKSTRRISDITAQMLAYAGTRVFGDLQVVPVQVAFEIRSIESLLWSFLPPTVRLRLDLESTLPSVLADVSQLHQLVLNQVMNAAEALIEESGTIQIRTRVVECRKEDLASPWLVEEPPPGTYVELSVQDDGCGISAENLPRIFDPFYSTRFTGRGLGLAAVLGIVKSCRGSIQVETQMGKGTTFKVMLPALQPG